MYNEKSKKAFSLLELLFSITIIAFLASVAIPKYNDYLHHANKLTLHNDVVLIRNGIQDYKNQRILQALDNDLGSLDSDAEHLFSKVLSIPIHTKNWTKIDDTTYKVQLADQSTLFYYDKEKYSFDCNSDTALCLELTQ